MQPQIGPVTTGLGEVFMYTVDFANPGGKGARVQDGRPGWQSDGGFLTPDGPGHGGDPQPAGMGSYRLGLAMTSPAA